MVNPNSHFARIFCVHGLLVENLSSQKTWTFLDYQDTSKTCILPMFCNEKTLCVCMVCVCTAEYPCACVRERECVISEVSGSRIEVSAQDHDYH